MTEERELARIVGRLLTARGQTLALAESCTGGLVAHLVTEIPGSSAYFLLGVVSYSNRAKETVLAVDRRLLEEHGAVSRPVAEAMATGVRLLGGADWGVGITGIAGPTGGTPDKPVGTVHVAVAGPGLVVWQHHRFSGNRAEVKRAAARAALSMLLGELKRR